MPSTSNIRAFIAGSSYPVVVFPFTYLGISSILNPSSEFVFPIVVWFFPIIMGIWNTLFLKLYPRLKGSDKTKYWIGGTALGIFLPIIGNLTGTPAKLWGIEFPKGLLLIIPAMIFYGSVWRFSMHWVNHTIFSLHPSTHES